MTSYSVSKKNTPPLFPSLLKGHLTQDAKAKWFQLLVIIHRCVPGGTFCASALP